MTQPARTSKLSKIINHLYKDPYRKEDYAIQAYNIDIDSNLTISIILMDTPHIKIIHNVFGSITLTVPEFHNLTKAINKLSIKG